MLVEFPYFSNQSARLFVPCTVNATDVFRAYTDLPDPVYGPDEVLISVEAISIEGGDLINRRRPPS
ncbi:hypothetical protein [Rhizobium deserti]|uniref:hypothetical protein n=1 Tax=Rhizobium deserti TaxID=2547961 RepID=UPI00192A4317|nr:hypothetical protein [Rhizobium deserti]